MKKFILAVGLLTVNTYSSDLRTVTNSFISELEMSRNESKKAEKQTHNNKAKEYAKTLLGIVSNVKINTQKKANEFCKLLEQKALSLEKEAQSNDKKISLKAKRDIGNFKEIAKFLKCVSKLFDSFYEDPKLVDLMLEKIPEFIPIIAGEIIVLLRILELTINSNKNFDMAINKIKEFAQQPEDGNYLISPIISAALENGNEIDYKKILVETDFSKLEICKYLRIR